MTIYHRLQLNIKLILMQKKLLLVVCVFILSWKSNSQSVTITGAATATTSSQELYQANFDYTPDPYSIINWSVTGGNIISQSVNPATGVWCVIEWNSTPCTGTITIYEDLNNGYAEREINVEESLVCEIANAGPDVTLCSSGSIIGTTAKPGYTYSWSPSNGLDNVLVAQPFANPATTTTYTLTMTPTNNLIQNGDFENGFSGFSTDYANFPTGDGFCGGTFGSVGVSSTPSTYGNQWCFMNDHSGQGTNLLFVDGSCGLNRRVWFSTMPVTLGTTYYFSAFATSVTPSSSGNPPCNAPRLRIMINGVAVIQNSIIPYLNCNGWIEISVNWVANTNSATIEIIDDSRTSCANDFALDDLFFSDCPRTNDNVTVTIDPNRPSLTPTGPIDYYVGLDAMPNGFALTSSKLMGNQWYYNNLPVSNVSGSVYQVGGTGIINHPWGTGEYYVNNNGCQSNKVIVNFKTYGYGNFGEEQFYFGSKIHPLQTSNYYCYNTTNNYIEQFNLGSSATYTWNFPVYPLPGGATMPNMSLTPGSFNIHSNQAGINIAGGIGYAQPYVQGVADLNGREIIIDYFHFLSHPTFISTTKSVCAGGVENVMNWSGSSYEKRPGSSGFDTEYYNFGSGTIVFGPGTGQNNVIVAGGGVPQEIKVHYIANTTVYKNLKYSWGGCYTESYNVVLNQGCREPNATQSTISIFPNPANSQTTIKADDIIIGIEILNVNDPSFNKVITLNNTKSVLVNISDLKPGIYICKVLTKSKKEFLKLQIIR
jgi:prepilin-type processing-associated H-X9-DG protein